MSSRLFSPDLTQRSRDEGFHRSHDLLLEVKGRPDARKEGHFDWWICSMPVLFLYGVGTRARGLFTFWFLLYCFRSTFCGVL